MPMAHLPKIVAITVHGGPDSAGKSDLSAAWPVGYIPGHTPEYPAPGTWLLRRQCFHADVQTFVQGWEDRGYAVTTDASL